MLLNLLHQIDAYCPLPYKVCVVDDSSVSEYKEVQEWLSGKGEFHKLDYRHGKREYWWVVGELFQQAQRYAFDYVFKLDDDIELAPGGVEQAIELFDIISKYKDKRVLNIWVDHRAVQKVWTSTLPKIEKIGGRVLRKVGWVDGGNWVTNRDVLDLLGWQCPEPPDKWWERPGDSSGVGKYLSVEFQKMAVQIYMPMQSLIFHGRHQSQMHSNKTNRPIQMDKRPWV